LQLLVTVTRSLSFWESIRKRFELRKGHTGRRDDVTSRGFKAQPTVPGLPTLIMIFTTHTAQLKYRKSTTGIEHMNKPNDLRIT